MNAGQHFRNSGGQEPDPGERGEALRRDQNVAAGDQFGHFVPVDSADIQPERDPPFWSDIRRQVEPFGLSSGESNVISGQGLAGEALIDQFVEAFNARDLPRLTALLLDNSAAEVVGMLRRLPTWPLERLTFRGRGEEQT